MFLILISFNSIGFCEGPLFLHKDSPDQQEFENAYQDIRTLSSRTTNVSSTTLSAIAITATNITATNIKASTVTVGPGNTNNADIGAVIFPTDAGASRWGGIKGFREGDAANISLRFYTMAGDSGGISLRMALTNDGALNLKNHFETSPSTPSVSSCGAGTPTIAALSTDVNGSINTGTGVFSTCTLNFSAGWTNVPQCFMQDQTSTVSTPPKIAATKTSVTWSGVIIPPGDVLSYFCIGNR